MAPERKFTISADTTVREQQRENRQQMDEERRLKMQMAKEQERIRQENLERMRKENEITRKKIEGFGKEELDHSKRAQESSRSMTQRVAGYDPLAPQNPVQQKSNSKKKITSDIPEEDQRFVLKLNSPPQERISKPVAYNPLQGYIPSSNQQTMSNSGQARSMQDAQPGFQSNKPMTTQKKNELTRSQLDELELMRSDPYRAAPRKPLNRDIQERGYSHREANMPMQRPINQNYRMTPHPNEIISQPTRLLQSSGVKRIDDPHMAASIAAGLKALKQKRIIETREFDQSAPPMSEPFEAPKPPKEPKVKKINPKNDPNCAFCFKCQIYHEKDLHFRNVPSISAPIPIQRKQEIKTNTVPARQNKPTQRDIDEQKMLLTQALGKRAVRKQQEYSEEEEDNEFDYDDDFIDDDEGVVDFRKELRKITGYNPSAYVDDDEDDRYMEVRDFDMLEREDKFSRRIEDIREEEMEKKKVKRRF